MRATELMCGDLVQCEGCTAPSIVAGITPNKIHTWWADGTKHSKDEVYFRPIPLTAEVLEKNGWEVEDACYANYKLPDEFSSLEFYFHESRLRKWWEGVDEWDNHNKVRDIAFQCHCTYVHELQHALRLCGLNELAENIKA